jgi:hypothetical protein
MSAGAIVVVALVAAAVAATATTAVKQATGSGEDNFNDAFGNWLKTFFVSFAANTVGGAAGAAGEGAGESMTAADTANAVKVGQAAQLGNTGANAAAGVGTGATTTTDIALSGIEEAEMLAAQGFDGAGAFGEQAGLAAPNTTGANAPGLFEPGGAFDTGSLSMSDLSPTKNILKWLELPDQPYGKEADIFTSEMSRDVSPEDPYAEQRLAFQKQQKQFGAFTNPFTQQAKAQAFEAGDEGLYNMLGLEIPDDENYQTSLGGFSY